QVRLALRDEDVGRERERRPVVTRPDERPLAHGALHGRLENKLRDAPFPRRPDDGVEPREGAASPRQALGEARDDGSTPSHAMRLEGATEPCLEDVLRPGRSPRPSWDLDDER